jgi:hypothetical protein
MQYKKYLIIINLIISLSLEIFGLFHIFHFSPYLLIGLLIAPMKLIYRSNKSYVLFIITLFFALQLPLLPIIEYNEIKNNINYIEELSNRKEQLIIQNEKILKNGAWGIYKENNKNIQELELKIENNRNTSIEVNYYKSFIEMLIIFLVEYLLFFQLKNFNGIFFRKKHQKKEIE